MKIFYNRVRDYDSCTGRFLTEDPIGLEGGDTNLYGYVKNDPVLYSDPQGLYMSVSDQGGAGASFRTAEDAARAVLGQVNQFSKYNNIEAGGYIYKDAATGSFGYGGTMPGTVDSVSFKVALNYVGTFHTHGGEDSRYSSEYFSAGDINDHTLGKADYLMTPRDRFTILQRSSGLGQGGACTPSY